MVDKPPILTYAPAPKPMSRKRLALLIGATATASVAIGGVVYVARQATPPQVMAGAMAVPMPALQPPCPPPVPGKPAPTALSLEPLPSTQPTQE